MKQKIKKVTYYSTWLIKFSFLTMLYLIVSLPLRFNKKYKNLWIIGERPDEARDNGYWLYKWILENEPDTNVRFVLAKNSVDYKKMPRKDLIIEPGSARHYIYYILSSYSVSTHMHGACPGKSFCIPFLPLMRHKKTVFLQHGITKDMINMRGGLDIITAASEEEKKLLIKSNPRYKDNVFVTGFCRYDHLKNLSGPEKEKIILVMPTFRKWLRDIGRLNAPDEVFKETEYFKAWNSFLSNKDLEKILVDNNMKLIFFPHNEIQKMAHNFYSNDNILVGEPGEYDVQNLLKKASILITDYSSVFFDFVYMNKPVVFYQFDQKDFFTKQYASSGKKYPFGSICDKQGKLIIEIKNIIKNKLQIDPLYEKDRKEFFKYRDNKNCERVFDLIIGREKVNLNKTIHYIWFGKKPLSSSAKKCIKSWQKYMPDYRIVRWDETNFDINENRYCMEAYENGQYAFASDYARLKILYENGGVYFDTDVELLKPIPEKFLQTGFLAKENKKRIATGLGFACKKGDETIEKMLDDYNDINFINQDGNFDKTPCPKRNTKSLKDGLRSSIVVLDSDYMNPRDNKTGVTKITKNTFSIHHYDASWLTDNDKKRKIKRYNDVKKYGKIIGLFKYKVGRIPSKLGGEK
ncbi:MAG: CDP-glycerol glycerophosphotransferase family protein [Candidatus Saccharibacteria bacterium]|nr:CDP-glycerol glycerophosphotransferase family protein [Candidatus Saccharibacteria bacterium]